MPNPEVPTDRINGRPMPGRAIAGAEALHGLYTGSIVVRPEAVFEIVGTHQGSLDVEPGAVVSISGQQYGSMRVAAGGRVEIEKRGVAAGSIFNEGLVVNKGKRGGPVTGFGSLEDLPGSTVERPVVIDGVSHYSF